MRGATALLAITAFLAASTAVFGQEAPVPEKPAITDDGEKVSLIEMRGGVEVRSGADKPWSPARPAQVLDIDWEISTGINGEALLRFADNSEVRVKRLTEMKIADFRRDAKVVTTRLNMKYGAVEINVRKGTQANDFQVKSPTYSLSVAGTKVKEISFYNGYGGMVRMGSEGKAVMKVNPTRGIGPGETTNDKLISPIIFAKRSSWVPLNIPGYTGGEQKSSMEQGVAGAGAYDKLRSSSPSNSNVWQPVRQDATPSSASDDGHEEPW